VDVEGGFQGWPNRTTCPPSAFTDRAVIGLRLREAPDLGVPAIEADRKVATCPIVTTHPARWDEAAARQARTGTAWQFSDAAE